MNHDEDVGQATPRRGRRYIDGLTARFHGFWVQVTGDRVHSRGLTLDVAHPAVPLVIKGLLALDRYEMHEAELVESHPPPPVDLVDVGGGLGYISCLLARHLPPEASHIVVEPNPELRDLLATNRDLNGAHFHIVTAAYTGDGRSTALRAGADFTMATTGRPQDGSTAVEGVNLASIVDDYGLDRFGLAIDAEGAEHALIEEEVDILADRCVWLMMEIHRSAARSHSPERTVEPLLERGFRLRAQRANPGIGAQIVLLDR